MVLVGGKVDEIMPLPIGRHAPGHPLLGLGQRGADGIPHRVQDGLDLLRLGGDVGVNGGGLFTAVMRLVLVFEGALAVGAGPHRQPSSPSFDSLSIPPFRPAAKPPAAPAVTRRKAIAIFHRSAIIKVQQTRRKSPGTPAQKAAD